MATLHNMFLLGNNKACLRLHAFQNQKFFRSVKIQTSVTQILREIIFSNLLDLAPIFTIIASHNSSFQHHKNEKFIIC